MATISITIPAAIQDRVTDALCATYGYQAVLEDGIANPQTKAQFSKGVVKNFVQEVVRNYEADKEITATAETARTKANTDIVLS